MGVCLHHSNQIVPSDTDDLCYRRSTNLTEVKRSGRVILENEVNVLASTLFEMYVTTAHRIQ